MRVRLSSDEQQQQDPEWLRQFAKFLDKNGNNEKFKVAKKVFVETYLENIREGMNPGESLKKAKSVALCFLLLQH